MCTVKEALVEATKCIKKISDIPNKEARILLSSYLKKDQIWIITHESDLIEEEGYFKLVKRRVDNEPIEYITNSVSFYGRDFFVDSRVLIPRPETEMLVDLVVSTCRGIKRPRIVEIGTGSGAISIMLAHMIPNAVITSIDISKEALRVAKQNIIKHNVNIELVHSDLCKSFDEKSFDILVSNPPYISHDESLHAGLSYEPNIALCGGDIGDEIVCKIIDIYKEREIKTLICEMGYDQREKIARYVKKLDLKAEFYKDLAGLDRGFIVRKEIFS